MNEAIIISIFKFDKYLSKSVSYKPIVFICNPCKILEKIVNYQFKWFLEYNIIIPINQFEFRILIYLI